MHGVFYYDVDNVVQYLLDFWKYGATNIPISGNVLQPKALTFEPSLNMVNFKQVLTGLNSITDCITELHQKKSSEKKVTFQ